MTKTLFLAEPIIISSHLFLINNKGFVFKINIDSGKIIWKKNFFKYLGNTIIGAPAISGILSGEDGVTLYVYSGYNEIVAINGKNGNLIWKKKA